MTSPAPAIVAEADAVGMAPDAQFVRLNGTLYKRQDGPFCSWKVLSVQEKRARMREYMRQYRTRGRTRQQTVQCAT